MWRRLCLEWLKERYESWLQAALTQRPSKRTVRKIRFPPHVSGYFWIRNFFFPDTTSGLYIPPIRQRIQIVFRYVRSRKFLNLERKSCGLKNIRIPSKCLFYSAGYSFKVSCKDSYIGKLARLISFVIFVRMGVFLSIAWSPVMWSKLKIVTIQWIDSRICDMIDDCYINNLATNQVSAVFFARYSQNCVTQIYRSLYGDAMFAPLRFSLTESQNKA